MKQTWWVIIGFIVLVLIIAVVYFWTRGSEESTTSTTATQQTTSEVGTASPSAQDTADETTIRISSSGFSPETVKIKVGGKVTFINDDSIDHQIASAPHPTHTDYPKLNVGVLKPGEARIAEFDKTGTFGYHDNLNPTLKGEIVVE